jgi:DNA-binding response OmpR family regulator
MAFKILIAEDEEITLKHSYLHSQRRGYEVVGEKDGRAAWDRMNSDHFDLLSLI